MCSSPSTFVMPGSGSLDWPGYRRMHATSWNRSSSNWAARRVLRTSCSLIRAHRPSCDSALGRSGVAVQLFSPMALPRGELRHAAPHVLQKAIIQVYVVALAGAQVNRRLVVPVEIRAAGFDQLELGGQLLVERGHGLEFVDRVIYGNPLRFLNQCPKFKLADG